MINLLLISAFAFQIQGTKLPNAPVQDGLPKTLNKDYAELLKSIYPKGIRTMSIHELKLAKQKHFYLLDTRSDEEFAVSHLKYARSVGYYWFDMRSVYDIPKDALIVTYCAVGNRSSRIADKLQKAGYKQVYVLYGGIFEWVNEGNPVYTQDDIQTPQIHGYTEEWSKWLKEDNPVL